MTTSRPWRGVPRELFAFATAERRDLYIAIMAVFEDAAVLRPSMSFDQVRSALVGRGWDEPLHPAELDNALGQLVGWGLLEAMGTPASKQDSRAIRTARSRRRTCSKRSLISLPDSMKGGARRGDYVSRAE